jgi:membrane-bound metal-dependent hydrolase YbcI (DUF457 family)
MPFTPIHMGPGLLLKALMRGAFSLIIFGYAQVLIDLQPLVALTTGRVEHHGWTHTWLGAVVIGCFAAATGRPLTNAALRLVRGGARSRLSVSWAVAFGSGLIGTLSHVALDSLVHSDMHALWPWSEAQPWLGAATSAQVDAGCFACGVIGAVLYLGVNWRRDRRSRDARSR